MYTPHERIRYVIPGEAIWTPVETETQLLRQLGLSVPRFTKIAVGLVLDQQNQHAPPYQTYDQVKAILRRELLEADAEGYLQTMRKAELEQLTHRLIDLAMTVANILRSRLHTLLGFKDWSLAVEDVILPRNDMVVSYETRDTTVHPTMGLLPYPGSIQPAATIEQTYHRRSELPPVDTAPGRR